MSRFEISTTIEQLQPGDIVMTNYMCGIFSYKHYGIYLGDNKFINYTRQTVEILTFENFVKEDKKIFKVDTQKVKNFLSNYFKNEIHEYTNEETIKRAKSRLGEKKFNLISNNCEHFVYWCKFGVNYCSQTGRK